MQKEEWQGIQDDLKELSDDAEAIEKAISELRDFICYVQARITYTEDK